MSLTYGWIAGYVVYVLYICIWAVMERVSIFKNNTSQAVRLPKAVAYPDSVQQVDIVIQGRARIITPAGESWDSWFESEGVSDDFIDSRQQPEHQNREGL